MLKQLSRYIWFAAMAGALTASVIANSRGQDFKKKLLDYTDDKAFAVEVTVLVDEPSDSSSVDEQIPVTSILPIMKK